MAFCLEAEQFVDDKLSNWYVRRNRRRFWKSEQGADKLAAYQTLYTVLMTLDEAVRAGHAVPGGDDVPEPRARPATRRASTCATTRRPTRP